MQAVRDCNSGRLLDHDALVTVADSSIMMPCECVYWYEYFIIVCKLYFSAIYFQREKAKQNIRK